MATIDIVKGKITDYDVNTGVVTIKAIFPNYPAMIQREYKECEITMIDSRPLSHKQRKACYAMIAEVAEFAGEERSETKEFLKLEFWTTELYQTADTLFSLSNAPMSIVAAFQKFLARFILRNEIPTKRSMLEYVDDVEDYEYACLVNKKCCICGQRADLHHVDRIGMGNDRTDIVHEGMKALPLCRTHHTEAHTMPDDEFLKKYHLTDGIEIDKTICKIYKLKGAK